MRKTNKKSGYIIIETMIAVSLFLVIIMTGMGSLLNANLLHQKSQNMRSIMDNLSFVMEDMSRNLRIGYNYQCFRKGVDTVLSPATLGAPRSCSDGWALSFESTQPILGNPASFADQWVYYVDASGKIWKSTEGATNFTQLTPDEVVVDQISSFSVLGAEGVAGDSQQPFVSIKLVGKITFKNVVTPFSLQTSVSQRLVDI